MKFIGLILATVLGLLAGSAFAADGFDVVSLGSLGGIQDGNLSANLISLHGDDRAVSCDAGTLVNGLRVAGRPAASTGSRAT